ncbi:MAG: hypothetical protein BWY53_00703 [Parcubacteria group bacterium ADurb.Bin326]|nr:MAG: hypothetical protein BWY53_00703 [Parcubacteria group bacterium ADurb.Bin326]
MTGKIINYLIAFAVVIIITIWGLFLQSSNDYRFVINDKPLVSVSYLSKSGTLEENIIEKAEKLSLASRVFSLSNPDVKQADMAVGDFAQFADYNIVSAGDKEQFLATATIKNVGSDSNNFISEILEDKNNQKFASLYPNQNYKVYIQFKYESLSQPSMIIINKVTYPISKVDKDFYLVDNFRSTDNSSVGLKTDNQNLDIQEAFFATGKINLKSSLNRVFSSGEHELNLRDKSLEIKIPEKSFISLLAGPGIYLSNHSLSNTKPDLVDVSDYNYEFVGTTPRINLTETKALNFVFESAMYSINNSIDERRLLSNIEFSIILIIIVAGLYYYKSIISFAKRLVAKKELWDSRSKKFIQNRGVELAVFSTIMIFFLALRASPIGEQFFSATNLLTILFFFLLIILRFSVRYMILVLLSLIGVVAILEQLNYFVIGEKAGRLLFLLILIIAISIIFSNDQPIVKKHYGKQKKK